MSTYKRVHQRLSYAIVLSIPTAKHQILNTNEIRIQKIYVTDPSMVFIRPKADKIVDDTLKT